MQDPGPWSTTSMRPNTTGFPCNSMQACQESTQTYHHGVHQSSASAYLFTKFWTTATENQQLIRAYKHTDRVVLPYKACKDYGFVSHRCCGSTVRRCKCEHCQLMTTSAECGCCCCAAREKDAVVLSLPFIQTTSHRRTDTSVRESFHTDTFSDNYM